MVDNVGGGGPIAASVAVVGDAAGAAAAAGAVPAPLTLVAVVMLMMEVVLLLLLLLLRLVSLRGKTNQSNLFSEGEVSVASCDVGSRHVILGWEDTIVRKGGSKLPSE